MISVAAAALLADAEAEVADALADEPLADALALADELPDEHPKMPSAAIMMPTAASTISLLVFFICFPSW